MGYDFRKANSIDGEALILYVMAMMEKKLIDENYQHLKIYGGL